MVNTISERSVELSARQNFMTKQGVLGVEKKFNEANSSKDFYKLLNNIVSRK